LAGPVISTARNPIDQALGQTARRRAAGERVRIRWPHERPKPRRSAESAVWVSGLAGLARAASGTLSCRVPPGRRCGELVVGQGEAVDGRRRTVVAALSLGTPPARQPFLVVGGGRDERPDRPRPARPRRTDARPAPAPHLDPPAADTLRADRRRPQRHLPVLPRSRLWRRDPSLLRRRRQLDLPHHPQLGDLLKAVLTSPPDA